MHINVHAEKYDNGFAKHLIGVIKKLHQESQHNRLHNAVSINKGKIVLRLSMYIQFLITKYLAEKKVKRSPNDNEIILSVPNFDTKNQNTRHFDYGNLK